MDKYKKVAEKIRSTYERNLFTLDLNRQTHFSQRMYRISGKKRYIQPIINAYQCIEIEIEKFLKNYKNKKYIAAESQKQFNKFSNKSKRDICRRKVFSKKYKEFLLFAYALLKVGNWQSFNIKKGSRERAARILKRIKFKKYFTDDELTRYYGTQLVNTAYDLKKLKVIDYTKDFTVKFKKIFMDADDSALKDFEYQNKVYGLTHFIIADSDYYQKWVSRKKYKWILEYFVENIDEILKRTNADIIAEVGLCFMLCNYNHKEISKKVKDFLINEFDKELGYISRGGKKELGKLEHTNIIAYMVLSGFNRLYRGPNLKKYF